MGRKAGIIFMLLLAAFGGGIYLTYTVMRKSLPATTATAGIMRQVADTGVTPFDFKSDMKAISDPGAIANAAARMEPSVVTIDTEYRPRYRYTNEDVDGQSEVMQQVPRGTGSGVIISADGVIVTNNHVVQNATRISVTLQDGKELEGRVVGADAQTDLAVVKVDAKNLPAATVADSDKVRVGEWALAVGDPLRVGTTVTAGIVSAIRKNEATGAGTSYATLIQTDAAINPGNSGGALADIEGRLIGINSAIRSNTGGSIGIGYAIPSNTMRDIISQLIAKGHVIRPWLGVAFATLTDRGKAQLNLASAPNGVLIGRVQSGSPAANMGLQPGDIIVKANDKAVQSSEDMQILIQSLKVGDTLRLNIWRNGATQTMNTNLTERPSTFGYQNNPQNNPNMQNSPNGQNSWPVQPGNSPYNQELPNP